MYLSKKNVFIAIFALLPIIVDQLNGFFNAELGLNVPIAQVFKGIILVLMVAFLIYKAKVNHLLFICILCILFFIPIIYSQANSNNFNSIFGEDLAHSAKLLTLPISVCFFYEYFKQSTVKDRDIFNVGLFLFWTLVLALIGSVLGFGLDTYGINSSGEAYGYKGYFISGNELSSLFALIYSIFLSKKFSGDKQLKYYFPRLVICIVIGLLVAGLLVTKTALLSFVVITVSIPFFYSFYHRKKNRRFASQISKSNKKTLLATIFLVLPVFVTVFEERIQMNIERYEYNLKRDGSVFGFVVSGRDQRYGVIWDYFSSEMSPFEQLIGVGKTQPQIHLGGDNRYSAEMDLLDALTTNGLLGTIFLYTFWFGMLFVSIKMFIKRDSVLSVPIMLSISLLLANTLIAGHILYSAMLSHYLALFFGYLISTRNKLHA